MLDQLRIRYPRFMDSLFPKLKEIFGDGEDMSRKAARGCGQGSLVRGQTAVIGQDGELGI